MLKTVSAERFALKLANNNFELWHDRELDLDYVMLREEGLKKVAQRYKKKHDVEIVTLTHDKSRDIYIDSRAQLEKELESLPAGKARGVMYVFRKVGDLIKHVYPFILAKNEAGDPVVVVFEETMEIDDPLYATKLVQEFTSLQADSKSCGVFAIHSLKHCLKSSEFMKQVFDEKSEKVVLEPMIIAQDSYRFKHLSPEKKGYYVRTKDGYKGEKAKSDDINHKAFYKGHDFLRAILSEAEYAEYKAALTDKTKSLVANIDEARHKKFKAATAFSPQTTSALVQGAERDMEIF